MGTVTIVMLGIALLGGLLAGIVAGYAMAITNCDRQFKAYKEGESAGWERRDVAGMAMKENHVPDAGVPLQKPVVFSPFEFHNFLAEELNEDELDAAE